MLGARIAALRRAAGWSQAELARRLGISPSAVGMYEQERREPSLEILLSMARLFQVTTDYLLTGQVLDARGEQAAGQALLDVLSRTDARLRRRQNSPFTRQELAVLFAAMLTDT